MPHNEKRIVVNFSIDKYIEKLKNRRIQLGMSRPELAEKIGKSAQQIRRYENDISTEEPQLPNLHTLSLLCNALQISPNELMGVEILSLKENPEPNVIYKWNMDEIRVEWECPICEYKHNITYGDYKYYISKKVLPKKKNILLFECEMCSEVFSELKIKKGWKLK